jgi:hypothetical protein
MVPKLVNEHYHELEELSYEKEPDGFPWKLGFVPGEAAGIAEQDKSYDQAQRLALCSRQERWQAGKFPNLPT